MAYFIAVALSLLVVGVHYETLQILSSALKKWTAMARLRVALGVLTCIVAHVVEVGIFTAGYSWMLADGYGTLTGSFDGLGDLFYFSLGTYTSLGIGDILPQGDLRIVTGIESLVGLVCITWTASFTFMQMVRYWKDR